MVFRWFRAKSRLCWSPVWLIEITGLTDQRWVPCSYVGHRSDRCPEPVWSVRAELEQLLCFLASLAWFCPRGAICVQGELACVQGEPLCVFELRFGGLCSLCELAFVSVMSSHCPCLREQRFSSFKWSCSFPLFRLSIPCLSSFFISFLFLFSYHIECVCCQCTYQGWDWGHVWFKDRWMVAFWCDEWLTTLCGLTLGQVLQV
jgi:hypothetical protein